MVTSCETLSTWQPVVERTRLRFPALAQEGWLYLTNTHLNCRHDIEQRQQEVARCLSYYRVFEPRDVRIEFDLPAYGGAEFSHVVLPDNAPVFGRSANAEVTRAVMADFSPDNVAWASTMEVYRGYFTGVTRKRFPQMAEEGWLWVLDVGLRRPREDMAAARRKITDHCMGLSYLSPREVCARPDLGRYPFGNSSSALGFLVPVFIRPCKQAVVDDLRLMLA